MYTHEDGQKRAVGFKLSEGIEVPQELSEFTFARQKSKLAGTIRGSYFVIKGKYCPNPRHFTARKRTQDPRRYPLPIVCATMTV